MKTDDKLQQDSIAQPRLNAQRKGVDAQPGVPEKKNVTKASILGDLMVGFNEIVPSTSPLKRNGWDILRHRWHRLSGGEVQ
jgi:hypothetical protein